MLVRYASGTESVEITATARDISAGGVLLEGLVVPDHVESLHVEFTIPDGSMPEEFIHGKCALDGHLCFRDPVKRICGIEFEEPLIQRMGRTTWSYLRWASVLVFFLTISLILMLKYENLYFFWFDVPIFLYSLMVGTYLISRFAFAAFYRRTKPLTTLPALTVIAPVFNEADHIGRTITQVMESAYPADKLQFIVVDDGSTDKTGESIEQARRRYPEINVISLATSHGKREALAAGVRQATGEILVFIDSDSFLDAHALEQVVRPFADPEVGAVTGHCDVENIWTNALTKMQAVRYYIAFRVMKAAESVFDSVTCLSGPLAAYRRSAFDEVMDEWLSQTFMGQPATMGDDRSLTNSLLRRGVKTVYAADARTSTVVPEHYAGFLRQQMRWKRSWFRESVRAAGFMWRKPPFMSLSFYLGFILPILGPAIVVRSLIYVPLFQHRTPFIYIGGVFMMSTLMSATYLFAKRSRLWVYGVFFCFFYMFVLIWQLPWAILTFAGTKWGTRS